MRNWVDKSKLIDKQEFLIGGIKILSVFFLLDENS